MLYNCLKNLYIRNMTILPLLKHICKCFYHITCVKKPLCTKPMTILPILIVGRQWRLAGFSYINILRWFESIPSIPAHTDTIISSLQQLWLQCRVIFLRKFNQNQPQEQFWRQCSIIFLPRFHLDIKSYFWGSLT